MLLWTNVQNVYTQHTVLISPHVVALPLGEPLEEPDAEPFSRQRARRRPREGAPFALVACSLQQNRSPYSPELPRSSAGGIPPPPGKIEGCRRRGERRGCVRAAELGALRRRPRVDYGAAGAASIP